MANLTSWFALGIPSLLSDAGVMGRLTHPLSVYIGSGDLNSCPIALWQVL